MTTPLKRLRWIDGNTTVLPANQDGAPAKPYQSPQAWLAALGVPTSADDAATFETGLLAPTAPNVWRPAAQVWTIPPSRNVRLQGFGDNGTVAPTFDAVSIVWNNALEAGASFNVLTLDSFTINSLSFVLTDTATSPFSSLRFSGAFTNFVVETFDYSGAENLIEVEILGCTVSFETYTPPGVGLQASLVVGYAGEFSSGVSTAWYNASFDGGILTMAASTLTTASGGQDYIDTMLSATSLVSVAPGFTFQNCSWLTATILDGPSATFDGPSWANFRAMGGTYTATTVVQVVGGFSGGAVPGANITGSCSVALNGVGASSGFTQGGNWYTAPTLPVGAPNVVSLLGGAGAGAEEGATICITRTDGTAGAVLNVIDAGTSNLIASLSDGPGVVVAAYVSGAWVLQSLGGT